MKTDSKEQTGQKAGPVYRVRMVYKNGKYRIKKAIAIEKMNLLKSLELPNEQNHVGSYVELRGKKGENIYRTHFHDPGDPYVRVSNEDGTFSHLKSNLQEKHFEVLVPDHPDARDLRFLSSGDRKDHCEEVFKITMTEIKKSINPKNDKK